MFPSCIGFLQFVKKTLAFPWTGHISSWCQKHYSLKNILLIFLHLRVKKCWIKMLQVGLLNRVLGVLSCYHVYVCLTCLRTYVYNVLMCLRTWIAQVLMFSYVVHACCLQISYVITCLRASLTSFVLFSLHFSFYLEKYLEPTCTPIKEFFEKKIND